jgi:hypothetical protein
VCKPRTIEIAVSKIQNLSFALQSSKGSRVHDPCVVDISLVSCILGLRFPFLPPLTPHHRNFPDPIDGRTMIRALSFLIGEWLLAGAEPSMRRRIRRDSHNEAPSLRYLRSFADQNLIPRHIPQGSGGPSCTQRVPGAVLPLRQRSTTPAH